MLWYSLFVVLTIFLVQYFWRKRWVYYYSWRIPSASIGLPLVGSLAFYEMLLQGRPKFYQVIKKYVQKCPPIFKVWGGTKLICLISDPDDLEIYLSKMLNKGSLYAYSKDYLEDSMFISSIDTWKPRRKITQYCFNEKVINSFFPVFVKNGESFAKKFEGHCGAPFDVFMTILETNIEMTCETIADCDPDNVQNKDMTAKEMILFQELTIERLFKALYHLDFFWNLSAPRKLMYDGVESTKKFFEQVVSKKNTNFTDDDCEYRKKRFLNIFPNHFSREATLEEVNFMFGAASETSAVAMGSTLLSLGILPEIQEKVLEEQLAISGNFDHPITADEVNRMDYLERVIKESIRLLPVVPMIIRTTDEDFDFGSCVVPKDTITVLPFFCVHRRPDLWKDPLKFDPDRFLPEEVEKRHRCAYLPFSFGPRNCVGWKYAILSIKVLIATFIRNYKILEAVDYKRIEDVELLSYYFIAKASKGYRLRLEKRTL